MNEFEAHQSSYDHQHKKRLKDMKEMQRQVNRDSVSTRKEEKGPLMSIKLGGGGKDAAGGSVGGGGGFKKGGFKKMNAFAPVEGMGVEEDDLQEEVKVKIGDGADSDFTEDEDYYDPRKPTNCHPGCPGVLAR
jgi:hypothetical protein